MFGRRVRNQGEFEGVVAAYGRQLLWYALRMVGDPDTAQDVVQDAFIRLSAQWREPFEPSPRMNAWLYTAVRNLAIDHIRKERRRAEFRRRESAELAAASAPSPGQGGGGDLPERAVLAAEALAGLDAREREIVVLRVYEEKSFKEISDMTGLTVSNLWFILQGALKKLARAIERKEKRP